MKKARLRALTQVIFLSNVYLIHEVEMKKTRLKALMFIER